MGKIKFFFSHADTGLDAHAEASGTTITLKSFIRAR